MHATRNPIMNRIALGETSIRNRLGFAEKWRIDGDAKCWDPPVV